MTLDGVPVRALARRWGVPRVVVHRTVESAMDVAHELGQGGAPLGTTVLAEEQTAGRGRDGSTWRSPLGGVWLAVLLRSSRVEIGALSIRVGLVVADAVDEVLGGSLARLKWPNDVLVRDRKLAGVLCEARWQGDALQWVTLGIGVNVCNAVPPELMGQAVALHELEPHVRRVDLLDRLVPGVAAVLAGGPTLTDAECQAFDERDWLRGRALAEPRRGRARGIGPDGALLVEHDGETTAVLDGHVALSA